MKFYRCSFICSLTHFIPKIFIKFCIVSTVLACEHTTLKIEATHAPCSHRAYNLVGRTDVNQVTMNKNVTLQL